jgi:8-oxo-dGTP pyrophosphatase MutT (NUDIX family)
MKALQRILGPLVFWLSWPVAFIYLRLGSRTRVLIIVEDCVLLVKGRFGLDDWSLPGGGLHRGEAAEEGAVREVVEETGIQLDTEQLQFLYSTRAKTKGLQFNYSCFYVRLTQRPPVKIRLAEIAEAGWVPLQDVSADNASSTTCEAVQAWLKHESLL